jgi:hypothetical protein
MSCSVIRFFSYYKHDFLFKSVAHKTITNGAKCLHLFPGINMDIDIFIICSFITMDLNQSSIVHCIHAEDIA